MKLYQIEADLDLAANQKANYRPDRFVFLALAIEIAVIVGCALIVWFV